MSASKPRVVAMIPARIGSERLRYKNLRLLGGKPVIGHVIDTARESGVFDRVVLNSDNPIFAEIAARFGVDFYLRPEKLGSSEAKSDDVVADFMDKHPSDILVWLNPIAPLQPVQEVRDVIAYFQAENLDSLITVKSEQVHAVLGGKPINFSEEGLFAKTQDLEPVLTFVYSIMMWRAATFMAHYSKQGYALLSGKCGYYPVHRHSSVILKREEDLRIMEAILKSRDTDDAEIEYDPVLKSLDRGGLS